MGSEPSETGLSQWTKSRGRAGRKPDGAPWMAGSEAQCWWAVQTSSAPHLFGVISESPKKTTKNLVQFG